MSCEMITSPHSDPSYTKEILVKLLFVLDLPLTVVTDTVFSPFILVKNIVKSSEVTPDQQE